VHAKPRSTTSTARACAIDRSFLGDTIVRVQPLDLLADRRRKALALNDDVVQRLTAALLALDLERVEESRQHVEAALKASQQIVSDLIRGSDEETSLGPGELANRREEE
jgi:hypothetical protein